MGANENVELADLGEVDVEEEVNENVCLGGAATVGADCEANEILANGLGLDGASIEDVFWDVGADDIALDCARVVNAKGLDEARGRGADADDSIPDPLSLPKFRLKKNGNERGKMTHFEPLRLHSIRDMNYYITIIIPRNLEDLTPLHHILASACHSLTRIWLHRKPRIVILLLNISFLADLVFTHTLQLRHDVLLLLLTSGGVCLLFLAPTLISLAFFF